ncbi:MAG: DUF1592 domain-containing protein [Polyangiaceae bacterium]|nr:DUF1592 domain-containing protein [Polyangiaceae bacterium]
MCRRQPERNRPRAAKAAPTRHHRCGKAHRNRRLSRREAKVTPRTSALGLICGAALAVVACTGAIGDPSDGGATDDGPCIGCTPEGVEVAPSTRFARLSHRQWENTVVDLFGLDAPVGASSSFTPDPLGGKAFDNNTASLDVTPGLWSDYQDAAEEVATLVVGDPALLAKIVPADLPAAMPDRAEEWLRAFGQRAWRRPLSADEVTAMMVVFNQGATHFPENDAFTAGVRLSLEAFLQSPYFVYRAELGALPNVNGLIELSDWEIATRLSYTLWDTMPDEELFRAAGEGELKSDDGLRAQIDRLLASDRARATIRSFTDQLSDAEQYLALTKSPTLYPDFDPAVGEDMREELHRFAEHVMLDEDGGLRELLTSRTTFVTAELAEIYGLDPATLTFDESGFAQVELDAAQRSGLLTRSGFLAWKGTETEPDTILRGVFINRRFICQDLGDPPDEAMGAQLGDEQTNRERVGALTGPGTCGATCHGTFINPIGFAFEHYGALGEWRDDEGGLPIDASASFPFREGETSFADALELSDVLADSPQAHACFARYWVEFTLGRDVLAADDPLIEQLADESHAGAPVRDVLAALLESPVFRYRVIDSEEP